MGEDGAVEKGNDSMSLKAELLKVTPYRMHSMFVCVCVCVYTNCNTLR